MSAICLPNIPRLWRPGDPLRRRPRPGGRRVAPRLGPIGHAIDLAKKGAAGSWHLIRTSTAPYHLALNCGIYRARKCSDGTLANLYVPKSSVPGFDDVGHFTFLQLSDNTCYYVYNGDPLAPAGSTPVVGAFTAVTDCGDPRCDCGPMDPTRTSFTGVVAGVTTCGCCNAVDGGQIDMPNSFLNGTFTLTGNMTAGWSYSDLVKVGTALGNVTGGAPEPDSSCTDSFDVYRQLLLTWGGTRPTGGSCWSFCYNFNEFATLNPDLVQYFNTNGSFYNPSFWTPVASNTLVCGPGIATGCAVNCPSGTGGTATFS
jgi:hypothetical protein